MLMNAGKRFIVSLNLVARDKYIPVKKNEPKRQKNPQICGSGNSNEENKRKTASIQDAQEVSNNRELQQIYMPKLETKWNGNQERLWNWGRPS